MVGVGRRAGRRGEMEGSVSDVSACMLFNAFMNKEDGDSCVPSSLSRPSTHPGHASSITLSTYPATSFFSFFSRTLLSCSDFSSGMELKLSVP